MAPLPVHRRDTVATRRPVQPAKREHKVMRSAVVRSIAPLCLKSHSQVKGADRRPNRRGPAGCSPSGGRPADRITKSRVYKGLEDEGAPSAPRRIARVGGRAPRVAAASGAGSPGPGRTLARTDAAPDRYRPLSHSRAIRRHRDVLAARALPGLLAPLCAIPLPGPPPGAHAPATTATSVLPCVESDPTRPSARSQRLPLSCSI